MLYKYGYLYLLKGEITPMSQHFVYAQEGQEEAAIKAIESMGGHIVKRWRAFPRSFLVEVPDNKVSETSANPSIFSMDAVTSGVKALGISPAKVVPESYVNVWGVNRIGAPEVHAQGNMGEGIRVVIVDTGGDTNHPDINVTGGAGFINGAGGAGSFEDDNGHGTHVHGTIAALLNGFGAAGVAPNVEVFHAKILDSAGSGSWVDIADAIQYCIDKTEGGTRKVVTNHSYGGDVYPGAAVEAMYQAAADAGVFMIAAAGNSGPGADTVGYPAKWATTVAVAATDINDNIANFSSTGPSVEVAAPGVNVYSTTFNGAYGIMSGTSMATPHVTGAFALALANGVSDPRAEIPNSTDRTERTNEFGWGIIDVRKLVGDGELPIFSRSVQFDGRASFDPDGVIVSWKWDVDGSGVFIDLPGGSLVQVDYGADGVYDVGLEVIDDQGAVTIARKTIQIQGPAANVPPVAEFTITDLV